MKILKKLFSGLLALSMIAGAAAPAFAADEGETEETETQPNHQTQVVIHKMKLNSLDGWPKSLEEGKNEITSNDVTYDGNQIENIKGFFGQDAEELANVEFNYYSVSKEQYDTLNADSKSYATKEDVEKYLGEDAEAQTVITEADGGSVTLADGYYWFVENTGTVRTDAGETYSGSAAVPFGLHLPIGDFGEDKALHVYPKNTVTGQPKTDKDFAGNADATNDRKEVDNNIVANHTVGDEISYEIETIIPANAQYKTAAWTDQMTEGLTFNLENANFTVKLGAKGFEETLEKGTHYTVTQDENGFVLELTKEGLAKINGQEGETRIQITYSATLNENAIVERQERNDMIFHYGNEPSHGNTPYPTKPSNGELKVTKDFIGGDWAPGESVEVTLYDAHTGKVAELEGQEATVTLTSENPTHTWTGLDNDRQYKVVETFKPGDEVTYVKQQDGQIKIEDKKTNNPNPIDPQEPGVVTYGHRFQKVDGEGNGLAGAEFVILSEDETQVLAKKSEAEKEIDQKAYNDAEKAYREAVKNATTDDPKTEEIARLKAARDAAYEKAEIQYNWINKTDNYEGAYKFVSQSDGFFKVAGLKDGKYKLVETKAPEGYSLLNGSREFTVDKSSKEDTTYVEEKLVDSDLTEVVNKKVTIPQTGGIGTAIFVAGGLALMATALVAMKRRNSYEA